jgi:hypothetical protein
MFQNIFAWYNGIYKRESLDEFIFQRFYLLFAERLLKSVNNGFTVNAANSTELESVLTLKTKVKDEKSGTSISETIKIKGSPDVMVTNESTESLIELKPPFSKSCGLYHTECYKPRDQLVLEVHSKAVQKNQNIENLTIGLLTDLFCSVVDICIDGNHYMSERVCSLEGSIQMFLLLCCKVKKADIPNPIESNDPYLTSTQNEDGDDEDNEDGDDEDEIGSSDKKLKDNEKMKGSAKLNQSSKKSSRKNISNNKENQGVQKKRTIFYSTDLKDERAEKLERMQTADIIRNGYAPLTTRNLNIHSSFY